MPKYVALMRAVNVAGRSVPMADVRSWMVQLGLGDVRTVQASGNALFESTQSSSVQLEALLEREAATALGLTTEFFVRSARDWQQIVEKNPYPEHAQTDPEHLLLLAFKASPGTAAGKALQSAIAGSEKIRVAGKHAYAIYPDGIGRSKLTNAVIEGKLRTRGTGRNWNTVLKLSTLARG